jgi:hypothetical protein
MSNVLSSRRADSTIFRALAGLAFFYCLFTGARRTADCISEEKREGTLGLLFLTDLRGYDVVAGKLIATSAQTLQGVCAIFPVLAMGLVLGGMTVGEFWRATAVLSSTLLLSLALGLMISVLSRQAHRAIGVTLGLLLTLTLLPVIAGELFFWLSPGLARFCANFSPLTAGRFADDVAYRVNPNQFWGALGVNQLIAWSSLLLASTAIASSWQDRPSNTGRRRASPFLRYDPNRPSEFRRRLLDINPVFWLAARNDGRRFGTWVFAGVTLLIAGMLLLLAYVLGGNTFGAAAVLALPVNWVLRLWLSWHACATFSEARRTGVMELILATPLTADEIIRGQRRALIRLFLWPAIAALLVTAVPSVDAILREPPRVGNWYWTPVPIVALFSMATLALDLLAAACLGMLMGFTQKKQIQAFFKTVGLGMIVPAVIFCLPNVLFDLCLIGWARQQLEQELRKAGARSYRPLPLAPQPAQFATAAGSTPPVIPT